MSRLMAAHYLLFLFAISSIFINLSAKFTVDSLQFILAYIHVDQCGLSAILRTLY